MIEVGDFIRTPYFTIEKVERIDKAENNIYDDIVITDIDAYGLSWLENNKTNHSKNKIDLIEVGDYVNGHLVVDKQGDENRTEVGIESDHIIYHYVDDEKITSIVTKEQFASMEYRVKHSN